MDLKDWLGTAQLWGAAFFVGSLWQIETDTATWIASGNSEFAFNAATYSGFEVFMNFVVFSVFHSFFFGVSSRLLGAEWAEYTIDLQVGVGGWGFYMAAILCTDRHECITQDFPNALNAGLWTAVMAAVASVPTLVLYYYRLNAPRKADDRY